MSEFSKLRLASCILSFAAGATAIVGASIIMGAPNASAAQTDCPTGMFPNLSNVASPGAGYAKPKVTVTCKSGNLIVKSNGMPGYAFVSMTPNGLKEQQYTWSVPLKPVKAASATTIVNRLGTLAFTVTGIPIYGPTEGPVPPDEAFGDPVYNGILDTCGGHTGFSSDYHDHKLIMTSQCNLAKRRVLGYAIDGLPIYNSVGCANVKCTKTIPVASGYVRTGNPKSYSWDAYAYRPAGKAGELDACNGTTEPDGSYGYHATNTFPYIIGCFKGTPVTLSGAAAAPMPAMGGQ